MDCLCLMNEDATSVDRRASVVMMCEIEHLLQRLHSDRITPPPSTASYWLSVLEHSDEKISTQFDSI